MFADLHVHEMSHFRGYRPLVFLSKSGLQVICSVDAAWKENLNLPMKLKN